MNRGDPLGQMQQNSRRRPTLPCSRVHLAHCKKTPRFDSWLYAYKKMVRTMLVFVNCRTSNMASNIGISSWSILCSYLARAITGEWYESPNKWVREV